MLEKPERSAKKLGFLWPWSDFTFASSALEGIKPFCCQFIKRIKLECWRVITIIILFFADRVRDCGMNFEWNLFQFTARDCLLLAKVCAFKMP